MSLRAGVVCCRVLLIALLVSLLPPPARAQTGSPSSPDSSTSNLSLKPPPVQPVPVLAPPQQTLPSLVVRLASAPLSVGVDEPSTVTLTIANLSKTPATQVVVTLPLPKGTVADASDGATVTADTVRWSLGTLDGAAVRTVVVPVRALRPLADRAVLLTPTVTAANAPEPVSARGGFLVRSKGNTGGNGEATKGGGRLQDADGDIDITLPADATDRDLTLAVRFRPDAKDPQRLAAPQGRAAAAPFYLTARAADGTDVHHFKKPLTVKIRYTDAQLAVLGLTEADLSLYWYNEAAHAWEVVPGTVDRKGKWLIATVDHFSAFTLGDGSSFSETYVPSLKAFQISQFTGAASYQTDLTLPAGPGGIAPQVGLSYSSAATDGKGGLRPLQQAGMVGKGWSLTGLGYIARFASPAGDSWNHLSLVFDGQSSEVVRGPYLGGQTDCTGTALNDLDKWQCWSWNPVDETFARVRFSTDASGGSIWTVWTRSGMRYEFTQRLWHIPDTSNDTIVKVYKWLLTKKVDPSGNVVTYVWDTLSTPHIKSGTPSFYPNAVQVDAWPREILWGYVGGTPRFKVSFTTNDRFSGYTAGVDMQWEAPASYADKTAHETRRLDRITVWSNPSGTWQPIRAYGLTYAGATASVRTDASYGQRNLTLTQLQQIGWDPTTRAEVGLPVTTFTYDIKPEVSNPVTYGGMNRLTSFTNGQDGQVVFTYELVPGLSTVFKGYNNYHRVTQTIAKHQSLREYRSAVTTTYAYTNPEVNDYGHSAKVVYAQFPADGGQDGRAFLAVPEGSEFRGHAQVTVTTYDGESTAAPALKKETLWFHQGNGGGGTATCAPAVTNGQVNESDACFIAMRDREAMAGRVYRSEIADPGAAQPLQRTWTEYWRRALPAYGDLVSNYKRAGMWRAFIYTKYVTEETVDSAGTVRSKRTASVYDLEQGSGSYGNLVEQTERDGSTDIRTTQSYYVVRDDASGYIVDRPYAVQVRAGGATGAILALTHSFYDGHNAIFQGAAPTIVTQGLLTRRIVMASIPANTTSLNGMNVTGMDTTYTYDGNGNQITSTRYDAPGIRLYQNNVWTFSNPGGTAQTTTTTYDGTYQAYPIKVVNAANIAQEATYDSITGVMTAASNEYINGQRPANLPQTTAAYDAFGRITALAQPGDTLSSPTVQVNYNDGSVPVHYIVSKKDDTGSTQLQYSYDGFGQQVQTKRESVDGTQNIVTDTRYDGLGRVKAVAQAHYVNENTSGTFWGYSPLNSSVLYRPTQTSYDALGRTRTVTAPDNSVTTTTYGVDGIGLRVQTFDAKNQATGWSYDGLGRLRRVDEYTGTGPHGLYATTTYAYDARDLLTQVTDAKGNQTTMVYDSAGRKTSMIDPDMGSWTYTYNAYGQLETQKDAKNQTIAFTYDALDRLTSKRRDSTTGPIMAQYGYDDASVGGVGKRTEIYSYTPGGALETFQRWEYDAEGRVTFSGHNSSGLGYHHLRYTYDTGGAISTIKYEPTDEVVTYTYDAAGREKTLCTSFGGCFVRNATYSATDKPTRRELGGNVVQTWFYTDPMDRLLQIYAGVTGDEDRVMGLGHIYDAVGNITRIDDYQINQNINFSYDNRDRLTRAWTTGGTTAAFDQSFAYDQIGNLTQKGSAAYTYGVNGNGTGSGPHQARTAGSASYSYDLNGNLLSGDGRTFAWTNENRPSSVSWQEAVTGTQPTEQLLSQGKPVTASSEQATSTQVNPAVNANDGNSSTRWAASSSTMPQTWQVDLGQSYPLTRVATDWYNSSTTRSYKYKVDVSTDGTTWTQVADRTSNTTQNTTTDSFTATARYVRMTVTGSSLSTASASAYEIKVYGMAGGTPGSTITRTEAFVYDADGNRVGRSYNGQMTVYHDGLWEDTLGVNARKLYRFGGQIIAQREQNTSVSYLLGDHLGGASAVVDGSGTVLSYQRYTPWGEVRDGNHTLTSIDFTGQRRDDSGLLFYNARYYDPKLARFLSADTLIPSRKNPQALNRYTYTYNNPIGLVDPDGHAPARPGMPICYCSGGRTLSAGSTKSTAPGLKGLGKAIGAAVAAAVAVVAGEVGKALRQLRSEEAPPEPRILQPGEKKKIYATGGATTKPKLRPQDVELDQHGRMPAGEGGGASSFGSWDEVKTTGKGWVKEASGDDPDVEYVLDGGTPSPGGEDYPEGHVTSRAKRPGQTPEEFNAAQQQGWQEYNDEHGKRYKK